MAIYPDVLIDREFIKSGVGRTYVQRMRIAGAKLTIDGSPQGLTAWRDRPYYKPLGNYPPGYSGYAAASADDVISAVSWAAENGIHIITHCNGERASDLREGASLLALAVATPAKGGRRRAQSPRCCVAAAMLRRPAGSRPVPRSWPPWRAPPAGGATACTPPARRRGRLPRA